MSSRWAFSFFVWQVVVVVVVVLVVVVVVVVVAVFVYFCVKLFFLLCVFVFSFVCMLFCQVVVFLYSHQHFCIDILSDLLEGCCCVLSNVKPAGLKIIGAGASLPPLPVQYNRPGNEL